MIDTELKRKWI